jgi:SDR family mycofactocin-dependent oxidoreductase
MSQRLSGKTALVTGAARGQGRSHALRLAAEGADLILVDVCEDRRDLEMGYSLATWEQLDGVRAEIEAMDRRAAAFKADVADHASLVAVLEETAADFPALDVIVANAAVAAYAKLLDTDPDAFKAIVDVNLTGVFNTVHAFAPRMVEARNGGSIILIGSTGGLKGLPFCGAYGAAKHGVHGLRETLAQELGQFGIRVNAIDPAAVDTDMANDPTGPVVMFGEDSPDAQLFLASFAPLLPLPENGMMPPSAISDTVAWLAGDESRFVTGISVPVDAGAAVR